MQSQAKAELVPVVQRGGGARALRLVGFGSPPEAPARLPRPRGNELHVLCPSGIGDFAWIWCKWHAVATQRRVKFWFPAGEQRRAHQYAELVGAEYGYLKRLRTAWVWSHPGQPSIPPHRCGKVLVVQANTHLEAGRRIEQWYPDLPLRWPQVDLGRYEEAKRGPYVLAFTCHRGYMGGNLSPKAWARLVRQVERQIAPVRFVGAKNDLAFIQEIRTILDAEGDDLINRHLGYVLAAARKAVAFFGVAGGPIIASVLDNACPCLLAYPDHLAHMPGSWEPPAARWDWCFVRELERRIAAGALDHTIRMRPRAFR